MANKDLLVWNGRQKGGCRSEATVLISRLAGSAKRVNVRFARGVWRFITSDRLVYAILGNRVYFKEDNERGYRLSSMGNNDENKVIKIQSAELWKMAGEYELRRDPELNLWYIEKEAE